jgi:hypothetical protein
MIKKTIFFAFVMLASATMLAQTSVTGLVKDAQTGETLLGANVKVSDKAIGTTTDFDGKFSLKLMLLLLSQSKFLCLATKP